jgi:hypothetical protein
MVTGAPAARLGRARNCDCGHHGHTPIALASTATGWLGGEVESPHTHAPILTCRDPGHPRHARRQEGSSIMRAVRQRSRGSVFGGPRWRPSHGTSLAPSVAARQSSRRFRTTAGLSPTNRASATLVHPRTPVGCRVLNPCHPDVLLRGDQHQPRHLGVRLVAFSC